MSSPAKCFCCRKAGPGLAEPGTAAHSQINVACPAARSDFMPPNRHRLHHTKHFPATLQHPPSSLRRPITALDPSKKQRVKYEPSQWTALGLHKVPISPPTTPSLNRPSTPSTRATEVQSPTSRPTPRPPRVQSCRRSPCCRPRTCLCLAVCPRRRACTMQITYQTRRCHQ